MNRTCVCEQDQDLDLLKASAETNPIRMQEFCFKLFNCNMIMHFIAALWNILRDMNTNAKDYSVLRTTLQRMCQQLESSEWLQVLHDTHLWPEYTQFCFNNESPSIAAPEFDPLTVQTVVQKIQMYYNSM